MGSIHDLAAYAGNGLRGDQATQRDWSPFVGHFTSYKAMRKVRAGVSAGASADAVLELLGKADSRGMVAIQGMAASRIIRSSSPSSRHKIPPCVCLSECSLAGLLGHSERYGRFGLIFRKSAISGAGGHPCAYLDKTMYERVAHYGKGRDTSHPWGQLFAISNLYTPPGPGRKVQDYTHEREWRVFRDLDLERTPPEVMVAPKAYVARVRELFPEVSTVIPLDLLHEWGL